MESFRLDGDIAVELRKSTYQLYQVNDEEELVDMLKAIFNSAKTQRVIGAILAQTQALGMLE
jgi:hypothetical protein